MQSRRVDESCTAIHEALRAPPERNRAEPSEHQSERRWLRKGKRCDEKLIAGGRLRSNQLKTGDLGRLFGLNPET
jgi:hypothetical protein